MRLPGDAGAVHADRDRADAEQDVDPEPDREKAQHAAVAQCVRQRQCRNLAAASASPRLKDRKLPLTKAKRIAAPIVPDTEADAPIIGATACFFVFLRL
jgi:hypothetical protein